MEFFQRLFETDFMPHGHCYFWKPAVLWTNVGGDVAIALSYFVISFLLFYFLRQRPDIKFPVLFTGFAAFILACGATHLLAVVSVWHPMYRLEGTVKVITALISLGTVGVLTYLLPTILKVPTSEQWRKMEADSAESLAKLQASENRFKAVMRSAPIGMALTNEEGRFLEVNEAMCQLFRYSEEEMHHLDFRQVTHPDYLSESNRKFSQKGAISKFEKKYLRSDGTFFWGMVNVAPIKNQPYSVVQILNIDDKKRKEKSNLATTRRLESMVKRRTSELETTNEDLENFIYVVTHDLRVPLQNLQGLTEVVTEEMASLEKSSDAQQALQMISENARRVDALIIDLMAFSRANEKTIVIRPVDMTSLVREVFQTLRIQYLQQEVEFILNDLPEARGDYAVLYQVWQNLLSNALKYSSKKPKSVIEVNGWEQDDNFVYSVQDNGIGFDSQYTNKLFNLFQRLHSAEEFEGTGVGLATSHRMIKKHGGRMWAESQLKKGATFYFSLPKHTLT